MKGNLWMLVVVVVFVGLFLTAVNAGYEDAGSPETVTEDIRVDYSQEVSVAEGTPPYFDNETVENSTGTVLTEGTDYQWDTSTGNVTWFNTSKTTENAFASITYAYQSRGQATETSNNILSVFAPFFGFLIGLTAIGATLKILGGVP